MTSSPFAGMASCPMAMTAHVVLEAIDSEKPATQSKWVIRDVIRKQLGFGGLLMTDDLSMKALSGSLTEKIRRLSLQVLIWCFTAMEFFLKWKKLLRLQGLARQGLGACQGCFENPP